MRGIDGAGLYLPAFRLPTDAVAAAWDTAHASGIERKTVAAGDEDTLTMGVAAGRDALGSPGVDAEDVGFLGFASTTPPLEEESAAARLAVALGLPDAVEAATATRSTLAGAEMLTAALRADGPALVVASDAPRGAESGADHRFGAAAVALLVDDDAAVSVVGTGMHTLDASGIRYRRPGSGAVESLDITTYERNRITDAVGAAVDELGDAADAAHAAVHQPDGKLPYRLADAVGVDQEAVARGTVVDRVGDAGAATVPLGLLAALGAADAGDTSLAAFFGSGGGATAFALRGTLPLDVGDALDAGTEVSYPQYLRKRGYVTDGDVAGGGAHVSLPSWQQSLDQRYHLVAGRCPECGGLAFPPRGACRACHDRVSYEPVALSGDATVAARTVIGQGAAPPEFAEQQQRDGAFCAALVEYTVDGASVRFPAQVVDTEPHDVAVGDRVRPTFRRVYEQEGIPRYGTKFVPTG